jgi:hypothetical protein
MDKHVDVVIRDVDANHTRAAVKRIAKAHV